MILPQLDKPSSDQSTTFKPTILKSPGRYTKVQWRQLIDSVWGPGLPTADKLKIFDDYWTLVDQHWGGFHNLVVNWDSLKNVYRPEVAAGVSRGRFAGILARLLRALNERHVYTIDLGIDSTLGYYTVVSGQYPNYPPFHYSSGLPLINLQWHRTCFGAGLTPLPDSTALVYNVMPNHPLGLQPGDIILGYDGIPWLKLFNELLDAELPITESGRFLGSSAATPSYVAIVCAGMNWGLFDTIDVQKYSTNQIVHYPTSLLNSIQPPYQIATEQLPVNGVPFPDIQNSKMVSWGVVTGTSIGYIYVWDWHLTQTRDLFTQAVDELMHKYKVNGMIVDFRRTFGGDENYANGGFNHLFNFDPISNYSQATRIAGNDHFLFTLDPLNGFAMTPLTPTPEIFDHPIAVLTGPLCASAGDYNAHRIRFHPMVRFFGLPTDGGYTSYQTSAEQDYGIWNSSYEYNIHHGSLYSKFDNEGFLIHKPFAVDEQVWLTRDGVAKGEDDVVKRAVEWINTLSYAHSSIPEKKQIKPVNDSVAIKAIVTNPLKHTIIISAIIKDIKELSKDSIVLFNDGLHGDGSAGDSILGAYFKSVNEENTYVYNIRTDDITAGAFRNIPYKNYFTSEGPVVIKDIKISSTDTIPNPNDILMYKVTLENKGVVNTLQNITVNLMCLDSSATINGFSSNFGNIAPLSSSVARTLSLKFTNKMVSDSLSRFELQILSNGVHLWTEYFSIKVFPTTNGVFLAGSEIPTEYSLSQNYPNPFNPTTVISYQLPVNSHVALKIFDLLAREVATLVNEKKEAGRYSVQWDASGFASGIYFYRLEARQTEAGQASSFVAVKKLVLVR